MENLLATQSVTIPPIQCSFPSHCHPDLPIIQESLDSWILSHFNPSSDPDVKKLLLQSKYPLFACLAFANAQITKRCLSAAKFIPWVCLLEDSHDNTPDVASRKEVSTSEHLFDGVITAFETNAPSPGGALAFEAPALEWWNEICEDMPAAQRRRCFECFKTCILGWKTWNSRVSTRAAHDEHHAPNLDVEGYIAVCREMSAAPFCFCLVEYCLGIELDEATLQDPLITELHLAVMDHLSMVNELVWLKRFFVSGEYGSLPFVIYFNDCPDLQKSVLRLCEMIKERDNTAARLIRSEIKKSKHLMQVPRLDEYLEGLGNWMAGNIQWSYCSARYVGVDVEAFSPDTPLEMVFQPLNINADGCKKEDGEQT